jgi:Tat protein secretion system quality control protein TatD with DNase activity
LPPVEFCLGTSPSQAANSLPLRNVLGSATVAAMAVAMIGPMPWNGSQSLADWVALMPRENLLLETNDPYLNIFDVVDHYLQHLTGNIRYTPIILV